MLDQIIMKGANMYVIMNHGRYVAKGGLRSSFTTSVLYAQKFTTKELAEKNKCGNEVVCQLNHTGKKIQYL